MKKEIEILPIYFDWLIDKKYPVNVLVGGRNSGKSFFMEQLATINTHNGEKYTLLVIEDIETNIGAGVKSGIETIKKNVENGNFAISIDKNNHYHLITYLHQLIQVFKKLT